MSTKNHRSGKKFGGNHTTFIDAALVVVDSAVKFPEVTNVSPGFIKSGLKSIGGKYRVKTGEFGGGVLLSIRGNTSQQEVRLYSSDVFATKHSLEVVLENLNYTVTRVKNLTSN